MTLEEIKNNLEPKFKSKEVHSFDRSTLKPELFIVIFKDGSQTNIKDIYQTGFDPYKEEDV